MKAFKPGDVVQLKSGSLPMTVCQAIDMGEKYEETSRYQVTCSWFDFETRLFGNYTFSQHALKSSTADQRKR
jgi:uncharacterized protein YodC (DUF2158 family)